MIQSASLETRNRMGSFLNTSGGSATRGQQHHVRANQGCIFFCLAHFLLAVKEAARLGHDGSIRCLTGPRVALLSLGQPRLSLYLQQKHLTSCPAKPLLYHLVWTSGISSTNWRWRLYKPYFMPGTMLHKKHINAIISFPKTV